MRYEKYVQDNFVVPFIKNPNRQHIYKFLNLKSPLICGNSLVTMRDMNVCYENQVAIYYTSFCFFSYFHKYFALTFSNTFTTLDVRVIGH